MSRLTSILIVGMILLMTFSPIAATQTSADTDNDGLSDQRESALGLDPSDPDMDNDGLSDGEEIDLLTNPETKDTDGDGVTDKKEIKQGTDPSKIDTDGDGVTDKKEIKQGTDPSKIDSGSPANNQDIATTKRMDSTSSEWVGSSPWPLITGVAAITLVVGVVYLRRSNS